MAKLLFNFILIALVLLHYTDTDASAQDPFPFYRKIYLPSPATGPYEIAFSQNNRQIAYVTVGDGRILRLYVPSGIYEDFAYTPPLRSKQLCDGNNDPSLAPTCGKVFSLSVDNANQIIYAVDAYLGLFSIQIPQGGRATPVTNTAGGQPLKLSTGVDVDPSTGDVYFIDASQNLDYRAVTQPGVVYDSTGRLIKYNPRTKVVTVLLSGLYFPLDIAVNFDGTFVLIVLLGNNTIIKYYLKGPRTNEIEVLLILPGSPRKVKRASTLGEFWVGLNPVAGQTSFNKTVAYKFNLFGRVLITRDVSPQYPNTVISAIQEINPFTIFVGSRSATYITEYSLCRTCL